MEVSGRREAGKEKRENRRNGRKCEPCNGEGVTTKADGLCIECEEFLCNTCFKHHLKAKQCRNHVFDTSFPNTVPLKRYHEVEKCKSHLGELVKFYCRKHEIVGCGECMIPDHAECSPENIKHLCKEFQSLKEFAGMKKSVKDVECLAKENSTKIKENRKSNAEMYKKTLNDIRQFRKDINTYLDTAEKNILQEAKEVLDANNQRLTKLETECMLQSSRIADVSGQLDPDLYSESGVFIQTVTLKSIILDLQQAISRHQEEINIKRLNFVPNKQLQSLTKSLYNFGEICCSPPSSTETKRLLTISFLQAEYKMGVSEDMVSGRTDCCVDTKISEGSRVKKIGKSKRGEGTVTYVGMNHRVIVEWDFAKLPEALDIENIELI